MVVMIADSILDEASLHVGEALTSSRYESLPRYDGPIQVVQQSCTLTHFVVNGLCILVGSLLQRTWVRSGPAVHPPG